MVAKVAVRPHPYLADLPVFPAEVELIAEAIREVGLLHPITLDTEGQVIGGRHRLAACELAGVEPTFETYDGDPLTFILHDNAARKHQTTGQRAAEVALTLDAAGRRNDGRWKRGSVYITGSGDNGASTWTNVLQQAGVVLDYLGRDALITIANGKRYLLDAYEEATQRRDAETYEAQNRAAEAEAEAGAREFIEAKDPELASQVGKGLLTNYREAVAVWEQRNREEVKAKQKADADREGAVRRDASRIMSFLNGVGAAATLADNENRDRILDKLENYHRVTFLRIEKEIRWPKTLA